MRRNGGLARDLEALRAGEAKFDDVVRRRRGEIRGLARWLMRRYAGSCMPTVSRVIDEEDVVQEVALAMWRAVDEWDPERGATLFGFVRMRVLGQVSCTIERILGWPRTTPGRVKRGRGKVLPAVVEGLPADWDLPAELSRDRLEGLDALSGVAPGTTGRDVAEGVLRGFSLAEVAEAAWGDRTRRRARGWESAGDAREDVERSARAIERALAT